MKKTIDLCADYLAAKETEAAAKQHRLNVEQELLAEFKNLPLEGTRTYIAGNYKIAIIGKLNRTLDFAAYQACDLPEGHRFVDMVPRINLKRLRAVEQVDPDLTASFITTKPGKTGIKITEVE